MNGNGVRDKRETITQAWARLGLMKPREKLTHSRYKACVINAANKLAKEGLLSQKVLAYYKRKAADSTIVEPDH